MCQQFIFLLYKYIWAFGAFFSNMVFNSGKMTRHEEERGGMKSNKTVPRD